LERRYGRFDRQIVIKGVLDPRKSHACLEKGILTVEIPTVKDRRGETVEIRIEKK
jgi:HSP20 family molecular chaperone IbpA